MKTSSAKAKGRRLQQRVAADIITTFQLHPDDVVSRPSSSPGVDVMMSPAAGAVMPYAIECKNVEKLNVWGAWDQATANTPPSRRPLLVMCKNNRPAPLAVLAWADLLELQRLANIGSLI